MDDAAEPPARTVLLGVAESDAHAVANRLIEMQLRRHGIDVINLGVCTPLREFAEAFAAHPTAEAVIIGSLNGHAQEDLRDLPRLRAAGHIACPVIVGGNLSVGSHKSEDDDERRLRALGVDHVLSDATQLPILLDLLAGARLATGPGEPGGGVHRVLAR
ncbi:cobalamin-dependent protein [Streptomyces kanamyceticus]|uniref:Methylaspartate mutase n=1 Tax=Streptomyces kanamyceticus TaxID=1967 RepID=A0A5J6G6F3_STRKN|nr:cobalamin-dependent protein [Streptomyces kanamyceticus]QEU91310.1 methylaspartate mutase [Streptomyces kanamyceticus]